MRRHAYALAALIAGGLAGAALVYFGFERPALEAAQASIQRYEDDLTALRERHDKVNARAAALEGQLLVEESTRRGLETTLREVQAELGRARDTLAFYEQLMPPGPDGAISIRALDIEPEGPHLKYRMLLMRSGRNDKPFEGELQFVAKGRLNGEPAEQTLLPPLVAGKESADAGGQGNEGAPLAIEFSEFQRSSGLLGLPAGFVPESVTVNVLEGRSVRVSRSVELPVQR